MLVRGCGGGVIVSDVWDKMGSGREQPVTGMGCCTARETVMKLEGSC